MAPSTFDNIISKFKKSTKQAADQMGKAAKIARLKMDIMTLAGERTKHLQTIGSRSYDLYMENKELNSEELVSQIKSEIDQIERIDKRTTEIEAEIVELQAEVEPQAADSDDAEVTDADEVKDVSASNQEGTKEGE
jgi:hypothetical protein